MDVSSSPQPIETSRTSHKRVCAVLFARRQHSFLTTWLARGSRGERHGESRAQDQEHSSRLAFREPPLGSDPEQNLQNLQRAVAAAQAGRAFHEHAAFQGHMRQLMAQQEPGLQPDDGLLELAETAETKRCAACRIVKPITEYYKDRTHSRGIKTRCKSCLRACKEAFKNQQRAKSAAEQVTVTIKKCSHCGQEKPASEFSRSSYQRTGLRSWCKECSSKSKKQAKAEGRWKSYDSKAKLHQQRIEELIAMQQPRKCRKCEEIRQPDEFPPDPRVHNSKLKECQYCVEAQVGGYAAAGLNPDGTVPAFVNEYWHLDQARAQHMQNVDLQQGQPVNDNLMRILQAAVSGNVHEDIRRLGNERLGQLGMYAEQTAEDGPTDAQSAAILQHIIDQQQQQRQSLLNAQQHLQHLQGYGAESVWPRETGLEYSAGQRGPDAHLLQYHEEQQAQSDEQDGSPRQGQDERQESLGPYDHLRSLQFASTLQHAQHPHASQLPHHDWSAFATIPRHHSEEAAHGSSPKRQESA